MTRQILIPDRIFDSIAGTILENHAVVIDDDRIDSVIPTAEVSGETTQVLDGYTLLPVSSTSTPTSPFLWTTGRASRRLVQRSGADDALLGVKHAKQTIEQASQPSETSEPGGRSPMSRFATRLMVNGS